LTSEMGSIGRATSSHLPTPVMMESTEVRKWVTHILCWTWAMYFSAAASSENDHGSMNLASNTASVPSTMPSRVATIQGIAECLTRRWTSVTWWPVLRSYHDRLSSSVALPSCTMGLPERSLGSASPRFSRQSWTKAASSLPMMMRASEPPMKWRRGVCCSSDMCLLLDQWYAVYVHYDTVSVQCQLRFGQYTNEANSASHGPRCSRVGRARTGRKSWHYCQYGHAYRKRSGCQAIDNRQAEACT